MTFKHTQEAKDKISAAHRGKVYTTKTRAKISANRKGKCVGSDNPMALKEHRLKITQSKLGLRGLYKDGKRKMAKPNSDKYKQLILEGYMPKI